MFPCAWLDCCRYLLAASWKLLNLLGFHKQPKGQVIAATRYQPPAKMPVSTGEAVRLLCAQQIPWDGILWPTGDRWHIRPTIPKSCGVRLV